MHHRCNKLHVDRRSAGIACRPKWVGWALVSKELTLCLLQDPSHETRRHRSYSRPGHSHSSSLGGRHLVARYLCTCQSRYPPVHATWSASRMSTYRLMTSRNTLLMLWIQRSLISSIIFLLGPITTSFILQSGVVYVQYEGSDSHTSGPSAAVMAASSDISFKIGRTG